MEMDQMREMANTLNKELERFKNAMRCLEVIQKRFKEHYNFVDDWCRKNNLISGIDKYLQESYFDMLRTTGEDT
jgi:hypothetical protein